MLKCNISLLRAPDVTYSLRTLACKWSGSLYDWLLRLWIMMMRLWIMMSCYVIMYREVLLIGFSWVCRTLDRLRMSMDLLGLWIESGSGLYMVWVILLLHMCHMIGYVMMLFMDHWHVLLMDAGWRLLANHTHIWSKWVMHDNERYLGRGVAASLPQPTSSPTMARTIG